jgi:parvulin-like peptidyl-prolyl isomerase
MLNYMTKTFSVLLVLVLVLGPLAVLADGAEPSKSADPAKARQASDAPAEGGDRKVMATVNGKPIYMESLHEMLVRAHGMEMAQQLVATELVKQEAKRRQIECTTDELQAESQRSLEAMFPDVDESERPALLGQLLEKRGVSLREWEMTMLRSALLRKLALTEVRVTNEEVRQQFKTQYGRKVVIRHIQTNTPQQSQAMLDRLRNGADFAELARKHSANPSSQQGGLLPAIGEGELGVPAAISSAALSMTEPGQVAGPVAVGSTYHILKLDKVIAARDVKYEDVRDKIEADLRDTKLRGVQQQMLLKLINKAQADGRIEFVDPILRAQVKAAARRAAERYFGEQEKAPLSPGYRLP